MMGREWRRRLILSAPLIVSSFFVVYWAFMGNRYSLWLDESFSLAQSQKSLGELLGFITSDEANMGPYYLLLWSWMHVAGGAQWARALSIVGVILSVIAIWRILFRWATARVAVVGVAVFALNPFVINWSIQARGYSLVMAAILWSVLWTDDLRSRKTTSLAVAYGLVVGLSTATLLTAALAHIGVAVGSILLSRNKETMKQFGLSGIVAAVTFIPFATPFLTNRGQIEWIPDFTFELFARNIGRALGGLPMGVALLVFASPWVMVTARSRRLNNYTSCALGIAVSLVGIAIVSLTIQPLFIHRYLSAVTPLAVLCSIGGCLAMGGRLRRWSLRILPLVSLGALSAGITYALPPTFDDFRWANSVIIEGAREGDVILPLPTFVAVGIEENWPGRTSPLPDVRLADPVGTLTLESGAPSSAPRVWIVYRNQDAASTAENLRLRELEKRYPAVILELRKDPMVIVLRAKE